MIILSVALVYAVHPAYGQATKDPVVEDSTSVTKDDSLAAARSEELDHLQALVDSSQIRIDLSDLPAGAMSRIKNLNFRNIDIQDLLRGLGLAYNLNLIVADNVNQRATIRLADIPVIEAVITICRQYGLQLKQTDDVFQVSTYHPPKPKPKEPDIIVNPDSTVTMDFKGDQLGVAMRTLSQKTNKNIVVRNGVTGTLSGYLKNVPFKTGLQMILSNNGFVLRKKDGIYMVDRLGMGNGKKNGNNRTFWINYQNNKINMYVANAPITQVIREIGYQTNINSDLNLKGV